MVVVLQKRRDKEQWKAFWKTIINSLVIIIFAIVLWRESEFLRNQKVTREWMNEANWNSIRSAMVLSGSEKERDVHPQVLVVYAGPTNMMNASIPMEKYGIPQVKTYKYHLNFDYFLKHGIQCKTQDTLIIVTEAVLPHYHDRIQALNNSCRQLHGNYVFLTTRQNKCLDLEAVRVAMYDGIVNVSNYEYFFYINCGVTGPAKELAAQPWTDLFIKKLKNDVKMTGLTHNCPYPHIQSMMYAMDRDAVKIVKDGEAIFDCLERWPDFYNASRDVSHGKIVNFYERKMGSLILKAGYAIDPLLRSETVFEHNRTNCTVKDFWIGDRLREHGGGRIPFLNETVFFKSTRYLSPELAEEIGYKAKIIGNWGK